MLNLVRKLGLTHWIFIALVLAVGVGFLAPAQGSWIDKGTVMALAKPLGDLFLRLLKMVVVPLILSSIVVGVVGLGDTRSAGRLGLKTVGYYLTTSTLAILVGLVLVNLVQPGSGLDLSRDPSALDELEALSGSQDISRVSSGGLWGFLLRMIPQNPFKALVDGDMLAVIFFAVLIGVFAGQLPEKQKRLVGDLFGAMFAVMMKITRVVILAAPVGIFGLVAYQVAKESADPERFSRLFGAVAWFFAVVVAGLLIHGAVILPLLLRLLGKVRNPYRHVGAMGKALLTAFSTASSNATLPVTMECVERNAGVSGRTSSFVLPLGATINMDGTALYECVVVLFIAQAFNFDLSVGAQVTVVITALFTSVGVAGVPMASLVAIVVILRTVGMESYLGGIGLIMVTDRILDMARTTVNVWSDSCGAVIIARSEGEEVAFSRGPRA